MNVSKVMTRRVGMNQNSRRMMNASIYPSTDAGCWQVPDHLPGACPGGESNWLSAF
jgi:hypothetical protein